MKIPVMWRIRYYLSKYSIWFGLIVMPEGEYKKELIQRVYSLKDEATAQFKKEVL